MAKKPGLGERLCPKCKEVIKADASICKHCRTEFTAEEVAAARKEHNLTIGVGCLLIVLLLGFCTYTAGGGDKSETTATNVTVPEEKAPKAIAVPEAPPEPASRLTGPQQHAVRSAEDYLRISGFSHDGLIDQLSSDAGEGYGVADATAAVDSLNIDWNEQAARSAQQYLRISGFSCNGLIEQLSSDSGDNYTRSQAAYGAKQAGAC
ncbi:Ltp family lipoprotein [Sphingobium yanoikuyae]|uniref:Ltp family lipoprotein n=1 Tax=Sphingobium yanoikuyae TaxID=13690 RepID=UPI002FDCBC22